MYHNMLLSVNVFPFLSHNRVSLLLNPALHPDKIALTNGAKVTSPNLPIFKYLQLF